ncbi:MAG: hypothetical protein JKY89_11865 [Immundisolibacteraceae bacterium]|nr:hypothetical protein [Immundisolibacteraceae bacterium]
MDKQAFVNYSPDLTEVKRWEKAGETLIELSNGLVGKLDTTRKDLAVVIVDIALAPSAHVPISGLGT